MRTQSARSTCAAVLLGLSGSLAHADVVYQNNFDSGIAGDVWSTQTVGSLAAPWGTFLGRFGRETATLTLGRGTGGGGDGGGGGGNGGGGADTTPGVSPIGGRRPIDNPRGRGPGLSTSGFGGDRDQDGFWITATRPAFGGGGGGGGDGGNGGGGTDPGVGAGQYSLFFDLYLFDTWDGYDGTFGVDRFKVAVNGEVLFSEVLETFEPWENELGGWTQPGRHGYNPQFKDLIYYGLEVRFTVADPGELLVIDFIGETSQSIGDESWGIDNVSVVRTSGRAVPAGPTSLVLLGGLMMGARRRR